MTLSKCIWAAFALVFTCNAQNDLTSQLYETYENYKEPSLNKRRIKYDQIQPLIDRARNDSKYVVNKVGESIEGRDLTLISIGEGDTNIFLWSQMHGDEPTATLATFDIFNFLDSDDFKEEKQVILSNLKLHFLPMVNPDGAQVYQRRNALGIDINRDALRLQSPEGQTLKKVRDSLDAAFGFNLHDQSRYYNAERTPKPATISYLATAYNYEKDINEVRVNAMKVIVFMNDIIQKYAPGQVGRYSDDFEPRAFGDNIAKWGTSLILIESGGYANDREKQEIRKLNYVSILSALYTIATESYKQIPIEEYEKIPRNDRNLFDLKIENATYELIGKDYIIDLGINRQEIDLEGHNDFYYRSIIADQGDLSTYYGYETFDATGYKIVPPHIADQSFESPTKKEKLNIKDELLNGTAYVRVDNLVDKTPLTELPLHMVEKTYRFPKEFRISPGMNPTFFLEKEGKITHAVINGFVLDLNKPLDKQGFGNALIYR
ncbi:M14 family zinc carboxypeptidase [Allomuricauda sp. SCSIO 65647]|uniref:M14 family zinc carboxypeptidase n=1 Tax=Allomuricauda sp. SCSIO 65647 TaxID=2908843 RepID=UPI001F2CB15A|nr:M14 family zinc carboxypeptidase [Muricauda sp. SCSIO 65647]UJH67299.1 peptidase M14 [Muricauda sp. SCSIO 65647]